MIVGHIGGSASDIDTGDIQKSLRFAASRSTYLSRTFGTPTNQSKWTWSGWIKRGKLGALQNIFSRTINASANFNVYIDVDDTLTLMTSNTTYNTTNQVFRDPTAWFHLGVIYDSANATPSLRVRIYVNGVEITSFSADGRASVSTAQDSWNTTITGNIHAIMSTSNPSNYHDGYLSRVCFVDGQALTPSSFGYLNTEINEWVTKSQSEVKAVVDAGGANSFMLDFDDGTSLTTLGYDKSSKGNNWTLNNHSLTTGANYDWMEDVPGNSFATLNVLYPSRSTLSNGNLTASGTTDFPTITPDSGTWYFERGGTSQTWTPPAAFPSGAGDYNFGQRPWQSTGPTGGEKSLNQRNLPDGSSVTLSGSFTGNAAVDGPVVWLNGSPDTLTINGNAVTFGTHADRLATGFKVRSSSASYNTAGSNTFVATVTSSLKNCFKYNNAKDNT